ncbi:MAG: hypothetical protein ABL907_17145, partial [Hyphomicrobium sp.]
SGVTPRQLTSTAFGWVDCDQSSHAILLRFADIGRFLVRDGSEIIYERGMGVPDRELRLHILGTAMGTLLHQRKLLPLHGSAVCVGGRATLFIGHQRAGKSSLAAHLAQHGHVVLNDDVSVVTSNDQGEPHIQPGTAHLKLWRDALESLGRDPAALTKVSGPFDKFFMPINTQPQRAAPVREILVLADAEDGAATRVRRLSLLEASQVLVQQTYRPEIIEVLGLHQAHFRQCVELAGRLPVAQLIRPRGQQYFPDTIRFLERHWRHRVGADRA